MVEEEVSSHVVEPKTSDDSHENCKVEDRSQVEEYENSCDEETLASPRKQVEEMLINLIEKNKKCEKYWLSGRT